METTKILFKEDHADILAEIFNMGMGQSLGAISKLTGKEHEIKFNVPKVELISKEEFSKHVKEISRMPVIVQKYSGELEGSAFFYLPSQAGKELARLMIGSDVSAEQIEKLESDALVEIGNIFINSSLSCLSNFLTIHVKTDIPQMVFADRIDNWMRRSSEIIYINTKFSIDHLNMSGQVSFILHDDSLKKLSDLMDKL